jgi:hypothetical protein
MGDMMIRKMNPWLLAICCIILLASQLVAVTDCMAKDKKCAVWDDDWDPVVRGRSYDGDPGYENWIIEALEMVDLPYDLLETQPDAGPTYLPTLAELRAYSLIIWNCAAESDSSLSFEERMLLRDYISLGGKLILMGQGILNDLDRRLGDPEVEDFLFNVLGLADYSLDAEIAGLSFFGGSPYFSESPDTPLEFNYLPDPLPFFTDLLYLTQEMEGFIQGAPPSGGPWFNLSSGRFHPDPIHFQSFLAEAIPDPLARGLWLKASVEWLGLEGDFNIDFMNGTEEFALVADCPDNILQWSPTANAMVFDSPGTASCPSIWALPVSPADQGCDWRLGCTFSVADAGDGALMIPFELGGAGDLLRVTILSSPDQPFNFFNLHYGLWIDGVEVTSALFSDLTVTGGGPSPNAIYRIWIGYDHVGSGTTWFRLADVNGNILHQVSTPDYSPDFNHLSLRCEGSGSGSNQSISGWVDDYFFEGCLNFTPTDVTAEISPAPGPRVTVHPNPFNPRTRIQVNQKTTGPARVAIYDISGRELRTLLDETREAGNWQVQWDGRDQKGQSQPSGLYLVRVTTPTGSGGARLILLK